MKMPMSNMGHTIHLSHCQPMQVDDVSKDPAIKHKGKFRACDFPGLIKLSREVRAHEQAMAGRLAGKLPT